MLPCNEDQSLLALITEEYQKVSLGLQLLEQQQYYELNATARRLTTELRLEKKLSKACVKKGRICLTVLTLYKHETVKWI